jgi:hypothetical protein
LTLVQGAAPCWLTDHAELTALYQGANTEGP